MNKNNFPPLTSTGFDGCIDICTAKRMIREKMSFCVITIFNLDYNNPQFYDIVYLF